MDGVMRHLHYFSRGQVARGFNRSSKQLGIATVNFPEQVVDNLPADLSNGTSYGPVLDGGGDVHKVVVGTGWNHYYRTKKVHGNSYCAYLSQDIYGEILNAWPPQTRKELWFFRVIISSIQSDVEEAKKCLELPKYLKLKEDNFFQVPKAK